VRFLASRVPASKDLQVSHMVSYSYHANMNIVMEDEGIGNVSMTSLLDAKNICDILPR
jgi:hypothetical protein